jgi:hypothetical protein
MIVIRSRAVRGTTIVAGLLLLGSALPARTAEPDARAMALVERSFEAMGGHGAWDRTRYLQWRFFGGRQHFWDRYSGDVRIHSDERLVLLNVNTRRGRAWDGIAEIVDSRDLADALELGYAWWVNDSYWLTMPYKLLDPGTVLRFVGPDTLPDGRAADVVAVTFEGGTGLTPDNRYEIWFASDTHLVAQWAYFPSASDPAPRFTLPWAGWKRFGEILLATERGRDGDWEIEAPDELPSELFTQP